MSTSKRHAAFYWMTLVLALVVYAFTILAVLSWLRVVDVGRPATLFNVVIMALNCVTFTMAHGTARILRRP